MLIFIEFRRLLVIFRCRASYRSGQSSAMTLTLSLSVSLTSSLLCYIQAKKKGKPKSIVTSLHDDDEQNVKWFNRIEMTGKEVVVTIQRRNCLCSPATNRMMDICIERTVLSVNSSSTIRHVACVIWLDTRRPFREEIQKSSERKVQNVRQRRWWWW